MNTIRCPLHSPYNNHSLRRSPRSSYRSARCSQDRPLHTPSSRFRSNKYFLHNFRRHRNCHTSRCLPHIPYTVHSAHKGHRCSFHTARCSLHTRWYSLNSRLRSSICFLHIHRSYHSCYTSRFLLRSLCRYYSRRRSCHNNCHSVPYILRRQWHTRSIHFRRNRYIQHSLYMFHSHGRSFLHRPHNLYRYYTRRRYPLLHSWYIFRYSPDRWRHTQNSLLRSSIWYLRSHHSCCSLNTSRFLLHSPYSNRSLRRSPHNSCHSVHCIPDRQLHIPNSRLRSNKCLLHNCRRHHSCHTSRFLQHSLCTVCSMRKDHRYSYNTVLCILHRPRYTPNSLLRSSRYPYIHRRDYNCCTIPNRLHSRCSSRSPHRFLRYSFRIVLHSLDKHRYSCHSRCRIHR